LHGRYRNGGILVQNVLGWIKVAVVLFMTLSGLYILIASSSTLFLQDQQAHVDTLRLSTLWTTLWAGSHTSPSSLTSAFLKVSWSFAGADSINNVLGEVQAPTITLKRVAPFAMLSVTLFYLLLNIAYFITVPLVQAKASGELIAAHFFARIFGPDVGGRLLPALVALSAAGNVMVTTFAQARLNQQLARQGFLPWARHVASDSRYGTPVGGLVMHLVPSLIVILLPPQAEVYSFVLSLKGYAAQLMALAVCIGLLRNRTCEGSGLEKGFRTWSIAIYGPIVAYAGFVIAPFMPIAEKDMVIMGTWERSYAVVVLGVQVCSPTIYILTAIGYCSQCSTGI
jgi:amino acid transporter